MKRITILMLMLAATVVYAQKPVKPNTNKALSLWKDGKLAEAKEMIDAATTYEKTMNNGETWYYRGLIYASIDTIANPALESLKPGALDVALESFKKADQLSKKGGGEYFVQAQGAIVPTTKAQQLEMLSNYYLNKGINYIQADEPDYEASIVALEKTKKVFEGNIPVYSNDTLTYYVLGLAAYNAEKHDQAIDAMNTFIKKGGKNKDAYLILYRIYSGPKEDKEKALELIRQAKAAQPNNSDFARIEISLLIDLNRVGEAKDGLEKAVQKDPNDKVLHFYLAYANASLKNKDAALKHYQEALRIDPAYFEAQYYMAQLFLIDVDALTKQINGLGISAADNQKKRELFQQRVKKCEEAIPYLEKAERMRAPDKDMQIDVLEKLKLMYYYVADDAKTKAVTAKLKMLGVNEE
jgi:tetratricopeptide (TPR) repeat protein